MPCQDDVVQNFKGPGKQPKVYWSMLRKMVNTWADVQFGSMKPEYHSQGVYNYLGTVISGLENENPAPLHKMFSDILKHGSMPLNF